MRGVGRKGEKPVRADRGLPQCLTPCSAFHLHSSVFAAALGDGCCYHARLTDGKTEVQGRLVTNLLSHSQWLSWDLNPSKLAIEPECLISVPYGIFQNNYK